VARTHNASGEGRFPPDARSEKTIGLGRNSAVARPRCLVDRRSALRPRCGRPQTRVGVYVFSRRYGAFVAGHDGRPSKLRAAVSGAQGRSREVGKGSGAAVTPEGGDKLGEGGRLGVGYRASTRCCAETKPRGHFQGCCFRSRQRNGIIWRASSGEVQLTRPTRQPPEQHGTLDIRLRAHRGGVF